MPPFKAVLVDWRGTLAFTPSPSAWMTDALRRTGRDHSPTEVQRILGNLDACLARQDIRDIWSRLDTSAAAHREGYLRWFSVGGVDAELGEVLYAAESDISLNPFASDVPTTLAAIKDAGLRIAVVSDIHVDIRPAFAQAGLADYVDSFVLSFEHGVQKPDPAIFRIALAEVGVAATDALTVGDRSGHDGAAVEAGITTLLLPPLRSPSDERLRLVVTSCGLAPVSPLAARTSPTAAR